MEEQEPQQEIPQQSQPPKPDDKVEQKITVKTESWIKNFFKNNEIGKYLLTGLIALIFTCLGIIMYWIIFDKKPTEVKDKESFVVELRECSMGNMDEITGEIHLKGEIKRGGEIKFKVHNKIKGIWEETLINETIDKTDGTFKFHFCKAITDYVRFDIKILGKEIPKEYAVDEIPAIIPLRRCLKISF